jgi:hypothetical protein
MVFRYPGAMKAQLFAKLYLFAALSKYLSRLHAFRPGYVRE